MPSQATVTAKTGPAQAVAGLVITNVKKVDFQLDGKSVLFITDDRRTYEFDIAATTTVTCSIAAGVASFVVNQA